MSFLGGRLAGKEAAYFFEESKHAVNRLAKKTTTNSTNLTPPSASVSSTETGARADVLPEVLRHSLPSNIFGTPPDPSSLSTASKWILPSDPKAVSSVSPDALNPLRAYVSLPQVTFGPKRWAFPNEELSLSASTANELRADNYTPVNSEKLKAASEGLQNIGKAFAVATAIVFGGFGLIFGIVASKLDLHNGDEVRTKGRDVIQPKLELVREHLFPLRNWAESMSKKWHVENGEEKKESMMIKELSKVLGAKRPN